MSVDRLLLAYLVLGTVTLYLVGASLASRRSLRIKMAVLAVVYFLYSGFGIAMDDERLAKYIFSYFLFLALLFGGVLLAGGRRRVAESVDTSDEGEDPKSTKWWSDRTATALAVGYLAAIVGQLIATSSLGVLLQPGQILLDANKGGEIFQGRLLRADNLTFVLLGYVKLLCLPFFYIEMQRRFDRKWLVQLLWLLAVTNLQVAAANQWGRSAWIQPILVWLLILLVHRRITGRTFSAMAAVGFVLVVPMLNALADWRSGRGFSIAGGLGHNLASFADQELSYPRYLPVAEAMGASGQYIEKYLYWLSTLPIPGSLTGGSFSVTRDFSERILGIRYGDGGFYVLLPGWLGESFIAFGEYYALWGLIVGLVIGLLDRFMSRTPALLTFDAFLTGLLAVYLRSVSQEFIAQAVGCLWILLLLFVLRRVRATTALKRELERSSR